MTVSFRSVACALLVVLASTAAAAQDAPAPPPPAWTGSIGAGLAVTSGNSDTSNMNLSFKAVHDPKTRTVFKTEDGGNSWKSIVPSKIRVE